MGQLRVIGALMLLFSLSACGGPKATAPTEPLNPSDSAVPPPAPPPPPQGAFLAQLSPEQTAQLNALGAEVVVPGVVPPTFSVADIRGKAATGGPDGGAAYSIIYRDSSSRCFAVEFAASGIGDLPATANRISIKPPLFTGKDYGLNYGVYKDEGMRSQFPNPELYTDWLTNASGAYRLIGANYINTTFPGQPQCKDITPEEAKQIAESFTVMAPEVMGDGEAVQ